MGRPRAHRGAMQDIMECEIIAEAYSDIYNDELQKNSIENIEIIRSIINRLGEKGYTAVDSLNQIDMVCSEQAKQFCEKVAAKETGEITIIVVYYDGSFTKYALKTKSGNVSIKDSYCYCENGCISHIDTTEYPSYSWLYEGGYMFFEEYRMQGYDGPSGHTALRVQPLNETCREFNRKYLLNIGYDSNNMFITDWNEEDFNDLNFYDLYEPLLHLKNDPNGYAMAFDETKTYEILKQDFEGVFNNFFDIDSKALQNKTIYHKDSGTYQYRTRGMYDFQPTANIPYPEITEYTENGNGTITFTVNAVYPEENRFQAFRHEVVVRPLSDGKYQFVSNHIIPSVNNTEFIWYRSRLTDEEWKEHYSYYE